MSESRGLQAWFSKSLARLSLSAPLSAALEVLGEVPAVLLDLEGRPVGLVTPRAVMRALAAGAAASDPVRPWVDGAPGVISEQASPQDAAARLDAQEEPWLVVVDAEGRAVGLLGAGEVARALGGATPRSRLHQTDALDLLQRAMNASPASIFITHLDGQEGREVTVEFASDGACRSLGVAREALVGRSPLAFDEGLTPEALDQLRTSAVPGTSQRFESRHRARDGRTFPVEVDAAIVQSGPSRYAVSFCRDLSEQRRLMDDLRRQEEHFRALTEGSPDTIARYDLEGRRRYVNPRLATLLRALLGGEPQGTLVRDRRPGGDFAEYDAALAGVLATGTPAEVEVTKLWPDGVERTQMVRMVAERDATGALVGAMAYGRDITAIREAEQQLKAALALAQEADRAKTHFLAGMSHELRTPLNGVLAVADLLGTSALSSEQRDLVDTITTSGESLLSTLNNVLDFSRLEAGQVDLARAPFSLPALLEHVLTVVRPEAAVRGLSLTLSQSPGLPTMVRGDAGRLEQVLLNLLINGLKYTDAGGVTLVGCVEDGRGRFEVRDTGVGIAAEDLPKLFVAFQRLAPARVRQVGGTGLGLAICRSLVTAMGGTLGVDSQFGVGSTFWFEVPLPTSEASFTHCCLTSEVLPRFVGEVLLAEDNPVNARVATAILSRLGFTVAHAPDGERAVELFLRGRFEFVLMDVHMPQLDGLGATRRIRAGGACTPILALTAGATPNDRHRCLEAGMDEVLTKPLRLEALLDALRQWVPRSEVARGTR